MYSAVAKDFIRKDGDGYSVFRDAAMDADGCGPGLEEAVAEYIGLNSPVSAKPERRVATK